MASFQNHIDQAKHNLSFLEISNHSSDVHWDWQVTVSFYVAVHLVNAHIAKKSNLNYRSHEQVDQAINPYNQLSLTRLTESDYLAYSKLQGLARRARYLCHEERTNRTTDAQFTYDKHFSRAIKHLEIILSFVSEEYNITFPVVKLRCVELKNKTFKHFVIE